ncbi:hypothetical protein AYL99_04913 [Fonsecaea erecta]|uniref:N-acetyltransferase domain-containing protein n=1 Tax=Fonsecaea erecta TaxID=1367422 RepID=A0A178ZKA3_9EURO|nr:hypothetical protein AYL99_04913 [Fonsecaea erecta]OAP59911.1 hypothetical protein AYL99_04913 [Fonsecaea erecta]
MSTDVKTTSSPDQQWLDKFISLLSRSYLTTPLTTAFITEIDNTDPTADVSQVMTPARLTKHFTLGITAAAKSNVVLAEAGSFAAAALFEPPDFCGIPPSQARRDPGPILQEWRRAARQLKAKYLSIPDQGAHSYDQPAAPSQSSGAPSEDPYPADFNKDTDFETRPFYHLAMIARDPDVPADKSDKAFTACMDYFLKKARAEGVPVWLETASESAMREYERLGFRVCEEVVIGKGRVNEKGWPTPNGGKGVMTWAMIWDEHLN